MHRDKTSLEDLEAIHERYPFLRIPKWGTYDWDTDSYAEWLSVDEGSYYYSFPRGWWIGFGEKMCEELRDALLKYGGNTLLHSVNISELKEKWGNLVFEMSIPTYIELDKKAYDEIGRIIAKYERLSGGVCYECGKPARWISKGYILPYCTECKEKQKHGTFEPIIMAGVFI